MSTLVTIFVFLHMLCWAAAFGMWIAAAKTKQPNKGMAHAAAAAPVFGLIAAVIAIMSNWNVDHMAIGIKFVISILVAIFAFIAIKKRENTSAVIWFGIPAGIVINMLVALFL